MAIAKTPFSNDALPELRRWMFDTGVTQADIASFAQVSQAQMSKYLTGKASLPIERAMKLSLITGIPVEKLLTDVDASRLLKLLGNREKASAEDSNESR
jgi:transcriptional regulator with XRE-family HTH domain